MTLSLAEDRPTVALARNPVPAALGLACLILLVSSVQAVRDLSVALGDTDDAMRLVQARALAEGRGWWDLIEPRLAPPEGLLVHWSRLVDGPLAALRMLCVALLGETNGELAARALWPLLLFLPAAWALITAARKLGGDTAMWFAATLLPLCWMVAQQFKPGRLDHHNVQLMLLALTLLASLSAHRWRGAAMMGALSALSLAVGFEALPVIAWACGLVAVRYIFIADAGTPTRAFGLAFAGILLAAFAIQTPPALWLRPACDALGTNMVAGAAIGGLGLAMLTFAPLSHWAMRGAGAAFVGAGALATFVAQYPVCLGGPYAEMDQSLVPLWLERVGETASLSEWVSKRPMEALSAAPLSMGALTAALVLIGRGERDSRFLGLTGLLALCVVVGVIQVRGFSLATAVAIPLAGAMIARISLSALTLPLARGMAFALLLSPLAAMTLMRAVAPAEAQQREKAITVDQRACRKIAAFADLQTLPKGVVLADLDSGPAILALTPHAAVAAPYHRIGPQIHHAMVVFRSTPAEAAKIIGHNGADYVALCRDGLFARESGANSFGQGLLTGAPPAWAKPLSSSAGAYIIYKIDKPGLRAAPGLRGRMED